MQKLTIGMVGVANFGAYRRKQIRSAGYFNLAALCDRNPEHLSEAVKEEQAQGYNDFDTLLEHPGLEGMVISTGADSHAILAIKAMERGLHVFVEKPLCCNAAEVEKLRRVSAATSSVVGVGHNCCDEDPLLNLAKQYIEEGRLGTVVAFEENTCHSGGLEIKPGDWRGKAENNPGGMLFQCGVHSLHSLAYLFGPPSAVQAMMRYNANPCTETADAANVLLKYGNGLVGVLNCYHVTAYCHELRIFGTKGNLYFDTYKQLAWFQEKKRKEEEAKDKVPVPETPSHYEYANLLSWFHGIRGGTLVYPGLEDGIAAVLPVFAAEKAAKTGMQVQVFENF